jgi:iron complex outermembrane recepter protein
MSRSVCHVVLALGLLGQSTAVGAEVAADSSFVYSSPDTVMVIGERVAWDPLRVPMAATVVPAEQWQETRTAGLAESLEYVPGVIAQNRAGGTDVRITSRGFGARGAGERSNSGTTRGIRITLDGFPLTEPDGRTSLDLADPALLEQIRVIRSNSSVLFGPASGGLIDLQSTAPFDRDFGEVRAEFGSHGYARQIVKSGFVSGTARIRVAGATGAYDGFRNHTDGSQSTIFASAVSDPSPTTKLGLYLAATHNLQHLAGALTLSEYQDDPTQADPSYVAQDARRDNRLGRLGARLEHRFADVYEFQVGVFVEPKTLHRSERNRYRDFQRVHLGGSALLSGPLVPDRLRWTVGADEALQDGSVLFYDLDHGQRGTTQVADQREGIDTFGLFGELEFVPADLLTVTAGARWDNVHYVSEDHQAPELDASRTLDRVSPRIAVSYRPTQDHQIFAALCGGIETPAFNEVDPPPPYDTQTTLNPLLDPSLSLTWEVGARGEQPGFGVLEHLSYDVALYTLGVKNDIVPWDGGAYYRTAGESRRRGIEIGLAADFAHGFSSRLAGTFTHNRYVDYETGAPDDEGNLVTVRYDDNATAGLPSFVLQGALRYEHPSGPFGEVSAQRVGKYWADDANTQQVDGYSLLDATVGTRAHLLGVDGRIYVSGRNLTDEAYAASAYINGANGRYLEPGMGRNVVVGVTLRGE